jgi:hydrogenase maturation protease
MAPAARSIVIGVGNPDRGDDAAGRLVARSLRGVVPAHVEVREHSGEGADLLDLLEGAASATLVDAWLFGAEPGLIRRIDLIYDPLPDGMAGTSTHGFSVTEAIELAQALGCLPGRCLLYAIAGTCFEMGASPSPEVAAAVIPAARQILADLGGNLSAEIVSSRY